MGVGVGDADATGGEGGEATGGGERAGGVEVGEATGRGALAEEPGNGRGAPVDDVGDEPGCRFRGGCNDGPDGHQAANLRGVLRRARGVDHCRHARVDDEPACHVDGGLLDGATGGEVLDGVHLAQGGAAELCCNRAATDGGGRHDEGLHVEGRDECGDRGGERVCHGVPLGLGRRGLGACA